MSAAAREAAARSGPDAFLRDWADVLGRVVERRRHRTRLDDVALDATELRTGRGGRLRFAGVLRVRAETRLAELESAAVTLAAIDGSSGAVAELPLKVKVEDGTLKLQTPRRSARRRRGPGRRPPAPAPHLGELGVGDRAQRLSGRRSGVAPPRVALRRERLLPRLDRVGPVEQARRRRAACASARAPSAPGRRARRAERRSAATSASSSPNSATSGSACSVNALAPQALEVEHEHVRARTRRSRTRAARARCGAALTPRGCGRSSRSAAAWITPNPLASALLGAQRRRERVAARGRGRRARRRRRWRRTAAAAGRRGPTSGSRSGSSSRIRRRDPAARRSACRGRGRARASGSR